MNIDELLEQKLETLLVTFFNTTENSAGDFEVQANYKHGTSEYTKKVEFSANTYDDTARRLTQKYDIIFERLGTKTMVAAEIINNKHISLDDFLALVYAKILTKLSTQAENYPLDAEMALAMFGLRGSADFNRGLYAVDLKNPTHRYVDNMFKLLMSSDELMSHLISPNFRELQPEYVSGKSKRNTQIRVNLKWYYDNVGIKYNINDFKKNVLTSNVESLGDTRKYEGFEERLVIYKESVLGRTLTAAEIKRLREDLEFTQREIVADAENKLDVRNGKIVSFAREAFEDKCVGCHEKYDIKDRSFIMPRNDRYYFEINHVIAYANDSSTVDVLDNLVKLCPTCHRALTPGRAYPELQKEIIKNMIESRPEVKRFVTSMMSAGDTSAVEFVFRKLK